MSQYPSLGLTSHLHGNACMTTGLLDAILCILRLELASIPWAAYSRFISADADDSDLSPWST